MKTLRTLPLYFLICSLCTPLLAVDTDSSARKITIDKEAWSGTSINTVGGIRQTLFTESIYQYTAYYSEDGYMVLGKRQLGEDKWELKKTSYKGNVQDAHNTISLVVDGLGYLHLAWNHHGSTLHYARSKKPHSLDLGNMQPMLGKHETSVTYPQFFRMPSGELRFIYRDGASGNGSLVMNGYNPDTKEWNRISNNLIDGENKRSAYWDMTVDRQGRLQLVWNWRETPDVASNHDLAYALSEDGGYTWQTIEGTQLKLPITQSSADYALRIPQSSNLMNPPSIGVDGYGNPYITNYWSKSKGEAPRFHVLYHKDGQWNLIDGPKSETKFTLSGINTKHPPLSRGIILPEPNWWDFHLHLIYRDDAQGGRIVAASLDSKDQTEWDIHYLTQGDVDAWEPSYDPVQWNRLHQAHTLLQKVSQPDGEDSGASASTSPISLLVWNPNWERHQAHNYSEKVSVKEGSTIPASAETIKNLGTKVAQWQWDNKALSEQHSLRGWVWAPFFIGNLAFAEATQNAELEAQMIAQADAIKWEPDERLYDADDYCVMQAYLRLYLKYHDPKMLQPSKAHLDKILKSPSPASLDWHSHNCRDRWSWCDSLFMGPVSWELMWKATQDKRYLDFMDKEWWATTERLYRSEIGLYFRDESFLDVREKNGRTIHWARGNGWVIAGLAQLIELLPQTHEHYDDYVRLFQEMCATFLKEQQADGLWRPGLLDAQAHPARESSGSSFITFAFAWGLNHGLLDKAIYGSATWKAWNALSQCVTEEGKLECVQPIGAGPHGFDSDHSEPFGVGAFLLTTSEVYQLAK